MLTVIELEAAYGPIVALRGINLFIDSGETVAVVGPNGAGKSTLMSCIAGGLRPRGGSVQLDGSPLSGRSPEEVVRAGVALVPEARHIFGSLSVRENLMLGATIRRDRAAVAEDLERMLTMFEPLQRYIKAPAGGLSGGEQQMLAIARALMSRPRLLLLDEPSLGLAPVIVDAVFAVLADLKKNGTTMLLVEQNATRALELADRVYALSTGEVQLSGTAAELRENSVFESLYLGSV